MRRAILGLAFLALAGAPLHADIADFGEKVAEAESAPNEEAQPPASSGSDGNTAFGEFFVELVSYLWAIDNLYTTYGPYPYVPDGYIRWADDGGRPAPGRRNSWYSVDAEGFYLSGFGAGAWTRLEGYAWRFFGPYAEAWLLSDGAAFQGGGRVGVLFSIFQTQAFSLSLYSQWNQLFGALERTGATVGLELRSYPFRPLSLRWRGGAQLFEGFKIVESELSAGLVYGPWEPYFGWRWWSLGNGGSNPTPLAEYGGFSVGLRRHL